MGELAKLINISKVTEGKLIEVGIDSIDKLKKIGSKGAYLKIKAIDESACICMLYGLEGAICGIKWHNLPDKTKEELKKFHNEL